MSRRSSRLGSKGTSLPDDDAASTSSTGSTGQVTYKESPVRIFKKRTGRKTGSVSRTSSRASSVSQTPMPHLSNFTTAENDTGMTFTQRFSSGYSSSERHTVKPSYPSTSMTFTQGFSSGYSSSEEHTVKPSYPSTSSAQPVAEPTFDMWDALRSPAQALVLLYWWLGTAWYSLTSKISLLNVFLLSRVTAGMVKAVLLFLLIIFFLFGLWYWFPFTSLSHTREAPSRSTPVIHTDVPVKAAINDHFQYASLSNLKDEIANMHEREANLMREIELLKLESQKQKTNSEILHNDLKSMKVQIRNVESEHSQQISDLRSGFTNLQSASDLLKERVDAHDTLNTNLKAELSQWLVQHLSDPSSSTVVVRPELQRALEDLEKRILDKLGQEKGRTRDVWRTVGETLQKEGAGGVTIQDVQEIVHRAISLYRADGIGMADYALESSGASVINTRCSETYKTRSACLSLFGVPLWYYSESPRTVIQPELYPGKCWAFQGSQGFLVISLSYPIRITHVTLEHLPRELSPTGRIDSAPKDFAVYGMTDENKDGELLETFMYDQDGDPIQTFKLLKTSDVYSLVELRILSNWGHLEYTCVYRFRVHGEPLLT